MANNGGDNPEPENALYDMFPEGRDLPDPGRAGTEEGFNTYVRLNDPDLFAPEALERDPALRAFADSGEEIDIYFAQFKSSTRESEWAIHKPNLTLAADDEKGKRLPADLDIKGKVQRYPGPDEGKIATFVINHDDTLARWKQSIIVMEDGRRAGQMIYKHPAPPREDDAEA